MLVLIGVFKS